MGHTEASQTGKKSLNQSNSPWDRDWMAQASHAELVTLRDNTGSKEGQNAIAPFEHRAFAREAIQDSPVPVAAAIGIAAAIPGYQVKKMIKPEESRSDVSIEQVVEGFKGVGEGLAAVVTEPWKQAWNYVSEKAEEVKQALAPSESTKEASTSPWMKMWGSDLPKPKQAPVEVPAAFIEPQFETVFARLIHQESKGKHTNPDGTLVTSKAGAEGITQLMKATAAKPGYGIEPVKDKSEKEYLRVGREYLKAMLTEFNNDYEKALAAYNAGVGNVKKAIKKGGEDWKEYLPRKEETHPYIDNILAKNEKGK